MVIVIERLEVGARLSAQYHFTEKDHNIEQGMEKAVL